MPQTVLLVGAMTAGEHCGVGDYLRCLAAGLEREGVSTEVLFTGAGDAAQVDGASTGHYLPDWDWRRFTALRRILAASDADLVHVHFPSRGYGKRFLPWLLPLMCRMRGLPIVITLHEPVSLLRIYRLLAVLYSKGTLITVRRYYREQSGKVQRWLLRKRDIRFIRSASTLPGVEVDDASRAALRRELHCDGRLLVYFGFLYPAKGAHHLLQLEGSEQDCIVLAGAEPDPDYAQALRREVSLRRSGPSVRMLGPVPAAHAAQLIASADALILPFEHGGGDWNTTLLAGIDYRTFVLTTSTTERGYDAEQDVYFARPGDVKEMKQALKDRLAGAYRPRSRPAAADPWL